MPKRMSFSKTIEQMRARTKTVTRRDGWLDAKPGDRITAIEKGMGLKPGEKQVVIGEIEVTMVSLVRQRRALVAATATRGLAVSPTLAFELWRPGITSDELRALVQAVPS